VEHLNVLVGLAQEGEEDVGDEVIDVRAEVLPGRRRLDATRELAMAPSRTSFEADHSSKKAMMFERQILVNHRCFETHNSTCWR
jgi:hypothetical protein